MYSFCHETSHPGPCNTDRSLVDLVFSSHVRGDIGILYVSELEIHSVPENLAQTCTQS
jgi:hypothetical protein